MSAAQDLLNDQQAFITTLQSSGNTAIINAMNITQFAPAPVNIPAFTAPTPYAPGTPPTPPGYENITLPDAGPPPEMSEALALVPPPFAGAAPGFSATPPTLDMGTPPAALTNFSVTAPTISTAFSFPTVPEQLSQTFTAPTLATLTAPVKPTVTLPTFTATMPTDASTAPENLEATFRTNFDDTSSALHAAAEAQMDAFLLKVNPQYHAQMAQIEARISTYLAGGAGLTPAVEDAIYARARGKNDAEARRVRDQSLADAAARGFTMPSGALLSSTQQARQAGADNNAKAASEIVVMQAEMEQKNLQFAVTTSAELRKSAVASMLTFFQSSLSMTGMALDYAKNISSALVQAYDIQVKVFMTKLDAYKAEASVYDLKSRVAGQIIDIYRAEIQAMEALANVDKSKIDLYRAQVGTLRDYAEVYKAKVDAVVSQASLEKLKIDLFRSQVESYGAQVQAKSAEWQGYQSRISGEEAKVKVFASQVDAFNGQIGAFKAQNDAVSEQIRAQAGRNSALSQELSAKTSAFEAGVRANVAVASGNLETLRQHYTAHKGLIDHAIATEHMKLEGYKANVEATLMTSKYDVEAQVANAGTAAQTLSALAKVHSEILQIYSGPASAAASGMNSLAVINKNE